MSIITRVLNAAHDALEDPHDPVKIKNFSAVHATLDGKVGWQHHVAIGISVMLGILFFAAAVICVGLCFTVTPAFIIPAGILTVLGVGMLSSAYSGRENEVRWHHHHAQPKVMQATLFYHNRLQLLPDMDRKQQRSVVAPAIHQKLN